MFLCQKVPIMLKITLEGCLLAYELVVHNEVNRKSGWVLGLVEMIIGMSQDMFEVQQSPGSRE